MLHPGFLEAHCHPGGTGMLDAVCSDKSIVIESYDGHSMWLYTKAMEEFGINREAVAGMMWVEKEPSIFEQEVAYVGREKANHGYPIKSIIDYGGVVGSHSDFPVSPIVSVPWTICLITLPTTTRDVLSSLPAIARVLP